MQPIQSNDVPTQRVRRAVDGCVSPLLSKIRQESLGHTLCGFQLHRHKHPPKCKMVSRVSAERISPHQSCPTSAGSVSEGSALSPGRKPSTGSHVTLQREEMNLHVWIYWRIWAPSGKLSLLWVFWSSESRTSQWRHQASASVLSERLFVPFLPESSVVCVTSTFSSNLEMPAEVFLEVCFKSIVKTLHGSEQLQEKGKKMFGVFFPEIYYTDDPIKLTENRICGQDSG